MDMENNYTLHFFFLGGGGGGVKLLYTLYILFAQFGKLFEVFQNAKIAQI